MTPTTCACSKCASMCSRSVCLPTPEEARTLLRRGYASRMSVYKFAWWSDDHSYVAPATVGHEGEVLNNTNSGACTFFKDGLCELHDLGLKPFEGRMAHHTRDANMVRIEALKQWKGRAFESVKAHLERVRSD